MMMHALVKYGPISAGILTYASLHQYSSGIYRKLPNDRRTGAHAILIVGYGQDNRGRKYWVIRNSWGHRWGEHGYFRMSRGDNMCHIETRESYIPQVK
jgi:C1A family cysteine protease